MAAGGVIVLFLAEKEMTTFLIDPGRTSWVPLPFGEDPDAMLTGMRRLFRGFGWPAAVVILTGVGLLPLCAQEPVLRSGPMIGYADMKEVMLWVQTKEEGDTWAEYWEDGRPDLIRRTAPVRTSREKACTARLLCDQVGPGLTYRYRILVDGIPVPLSGPATFRTQPLWQWRTDPPDFRLATGSCTYINEPELDRPGKPYGGDYRIFDAIVAQKPDLMVWLGDNTYLREADWSTRTGIYHRYSHTRSAPELQPLLAACSHYAIWDDHDFGPNDSDRSFPFKGLTREAFGDFWANPGPGIPGLEGITSAFMWGDIAFFLLDNRWDRSPNDCQGCVPAILGRAQREWLVEALAASRAPFKMVVIGGQVLNPAPRFENYAHRHGSERDWLLQRIEQEKLEGVVFLTGDRHHTELSALQNRNGHRVYDLTVSPLTSTASRNNRDEGNTLRVEGTYVGDRNFATLDFRGKRHQRILHIRVFDVQGQMLWEQEIRQPGYKE